MNSVNATWISESFQPVCVWAGTTKSVQAYCRFAIMIIATSEATSWNQRLFIMTVLPPQWGATTGRTLRFGGGVLPPPTQSRRSAQRRFQRGAHGARGDFLRNT